ncbi:MAG: Smr/MutS family protein [bacterium]
MNNHDAKIFAAQLSDDLPILDLHGLYPSDALDRLEIFLFDHHDKNNEKVIRIVYGGGTGRLGEKVKGYLKNHGLVQEIIEEHGACLAVL